MPKDQETSLLADLNIKYDNQIKQQLLDIKDLEDKIAKLGKTIASMDADIAKRSETIQNIGQKEDKILQERAMVLRSMEDDIRGREQETYKREVNLTILEDKLNERLEEVEKQAESYSKRVLELEEKMEKLHLQRESLGEEKQLYDSLRVSLEQELQETVDSKTNTESALKKYEGLVESTGELQASLEKQLSDISAGKAEVDRQASFLNYQLTLLKNKQDELDKRVAEVVKREEQIKASEESIKNSQEEIDFRDKELKLKDMKLNKIIREKNIEKELESMGG
jgi:chromosome segregation ATPase